MLKTKKKKLTVVGRHGRYKPICIRYVADLQEIPISYKTS